MTAARRFAITVAVMGPRRGASTTATATATANRSSNAMEGGTVPTLRTDGTSEVPLVAGGFLCPSVAHFASEAAVKADDDAPLIVT